MTLKDFKDLPGLISRKKFMQVTGLDRWDMEALVKAGELRVFRRPEVMTNGQNPNDKGNPNEVPGIFGMAPAIVEAARNPANAQKGTKETKGRKKNVKHFSGQRRGVYGRYYTVEAARLCGFDLNK